MFCIQKGKVLLEKFDRKFEEFCIPAKTVFYKFFEKNPMAPKFFA